MHRHGGSLPSVRLIIGKHVPVGLVKEYSVANWQEDPVRETVR